MVLVLACEYIVGVPEAVDDPGFFWWRTSAAGTWI
jgi:hypothetical protein